MDRVCRTASLFTLLLSAVPAQVDWRKAPVLDARSGHGLAYDVSRQRTVLFGGYSGAALDDTWEWDGAVWLRRDVTVRPAARRNHAIAYDVARSRVVVFGGDGGAGGFRDTWEWDGRAWSMRTPAASPPAFASAAMAYDVRRAHTVLFGASPGPFGGGVGETWEWDGNAWVKRTPATLPPMRIGHAVAYDLARDRVVMFGGFDGQFGSAPFADTWEWDGRDWSLRTPANRPTGRVDHALAYDALRQRVVLVGGRGTNPFALPQSDTWEWDGNDWARRNPATTPYGMSDHGVAYDIVRGRLVAWGGWLAPTATWEWDGGDWSRVAPASSPSLRREAAMVFDVGNDRSVLFGVDAASWQAATWEWDGVRWIERAPPQSPPTRWLHAMAYDTVRGRVLLFGGEDGSTRFDDTWVWDGTTWQNRVVATRPPWRTGHAIAFDVHRGVAVMFGGRSASGISLPLADTWEWDGRAWARRSPATSPVGRSDHAMAYDALRRRIVLFGGLTGVVGPVVNDTWLWDGNDWTLATPATRAPVRLYHDMVFDAARERVVLFGGATPLPTNETWEWDGAEWRQRATPTALPPRGRNVMAYDAGREQVVTFGGENFGDTWLYESAAQARYSWFGGGCRGSAGTPAIDGRRRPWMGDRFEIAIGNLVPSRPAFLVTGFSNTSWGATPLPLPLAFIGMPGCALRVSVDLVEALANPNGTAHYRVAIPNDASLIGARFFHQAIGFDPPANRLGAVVSDAFAGWIGVR